MEQAVARARQLVAKKQVGKEREGLMPSGTIFVTAEACVWARSKSEGLDRVAPIDLQLDPAINPYAGLITALTSICQHPVAAHFQ